MINGNSVSGTLASNTFGLVGQAYDLSQNKVFVNGTSVSSNYSTPISSGTTPFYLGGRGSSNSLNGDIAEVLLFDSPLSISERQDLEAYLYAKYGVGTKPVLEAPSMSVPSVIQISGTLAVTLSAENGDIYYTVDGSEPTTNSTRYTGAIQISGSTILKAIAGRLGYQSSAVATSVITVDNSTADVPRNGLNLWLVGDVGVTLDGSNKVGEWKDQSGQGNHAVQGTSSRRPALITNEFNGKAVVRFSSGSTTFLASPHHSSLNNSQMSLFTVMRRNSGTGGATIVEKYNTGSSAGYSLHYDATTVPRTKINSNSAYGSLATNTIGAVGMVYDQQTNRLFVNGVTSSTGYTTAITSSTTPFYIGGRGTSNNLTGDVAEVLFYNRAVTENERKAIEAYFYFKYGAGVAPALSAPVIGTASGVYSETQSVSITAEDGATIHYTDDGSEPTTLSPAYTQSIAVNASTAIKAIAVKNGYQQSAVASAEIHVDPTVAHLPRTGLNLWLVGEFGITMDGSNKVSEWKDQSGLGNHAVQGTSSRQPTFVTNQFNGKPVLRFSSGSTTFLSVPNNSSLTSSQISLFTVLKRTAGSAEVVIAEKYNTGSNGGYSLRYDGNYPQAKINSNEAYVALATNTLGAVAMIYNQSANRVIANGTASSSSYATGISSTSTPFYVGGRGTSANLTGDVAEMLFYNRAVTEEERKDIEAYFYLKYGAGNPPALEAPVITGAGVYTESKTVQLSAQPGTAIYYTLDGSTPTTSSLLYNGSFSISTTTTVKAIAVKAGFADSPVVTSVIVVDPSSQQVVRNGLKVWLMADAGVSTTGTAGMVTKWADQSGNENHFMQQSGFAGPSLQANILGGKPVVRFSASQDTSLELPGSSSWAPSQFTLFVMARRISGTSSAIVMEKYDSSTSSGFRLRYDTQLRSTINSHQVSRSASLNSFALFTQSYDGSGHSLLVDDDGTRSTLLSGPRGCYVFTLKLVTLAWRTQPSVNLQRYSPAAHNP